MRQLTNDRSRIVGTVRDNPLPVALIGLGIGWLALSGGWGRSRRTEMEEEEELGASYGSMEGISPAGGYGYAPGVETPAYGGGVAGRDYAAAQTSESGLGVAPESAQGTVSRAAQRTRRRVSQWSRSARESAGDAADRTWEAYRDRPFTAGLIALVAGGVLGAVLPRTITERRVLGPAVDSAVRQARETGVELAEKAGKVVERAGHAVKEEGGEALRHVTQAAQDEARKQGLTGGSPSSMTH